MKPRAHVVLLYSIVLVLCGCVWAKNVGRVMRDSALPAAGACLGFLVTGPLGGVAVLGGIFAGAALGDMIQENASMASGETVTDDMLIRQLATYKVKTFLAEVEVEDAKAKMTLAQMAAAGAKKVALTIAWIVIGIFLVWFIWRNRHNIWQLGWKDGLKHSLLGGQVGKTRTNFK